MYVKEIMESLCDINVGSSIIYIEELRFYYRSFRIYMVFTNGTDLYVTDSKAVVPKLSVFKACSITRTLMIHSKNSFEDSKKKSVLVSW